MEDLETDNPAPTIIQPLGVDRGNANSIGTETNFRIVDAVVAPRDAETLIAVIHVDLAVEVRGNIENHPIVEEVTKRRRNRMVRKTEFG